MSHPQIDGALKLQVGPWMSPDELMQMVWDVQKGINGECSECNRPLDGSGHCGHCGLTQ